MGPVAQKKRCIDVLSRLRIFRWSHPREVSMPAELTLLVGGKCCRQQLVEDF